ncbi:LysE family transporter [Marinobacter sp. CHS3-4]|uniref:LysE/ArgO family amino acid transporter n=1 Tax=Marinobacter sp. CHS3-4 TaxID=3045174 RepID=UPI0024B57A4B|nr:LysE family transporter [Marinobacter sp. CHS3-4]MDI9246023.1 LysE/ArgO family amino acid transporter [Marinobacter sp. CHS3-4]
MLTSFLTGLIVCGGIIIAIGAQNAYILGQAIRREHHWTCVGICMSADILLFTLGMLGVSAALLAVPEAMEALRWLGVAFLTWLAAVAFFNVIRGRQGLDPESRAETSFKAVVMTTLAVTLLNPQVYLDTLLLIPSIGAQQGSQVAFFAGASTASVLWFSALGLAGAALSPWLARPLAWRFIDGAIGTMMAGIAIHLASNGLQGPMV